MATLLIAGSVASVTVCGSTDTGDDAKTNEDGVTKIVFAYRNTGNWPTTGEDERKNGGRPDMSKVYHNIIEMVGDTPILQLQKIEAQFGTQAHIYAKLECFNPGGSVKDRIALNMIEAAEREGIIHPGGTLIESTSGNTGIGIAAIGAAKGYHVIITMPENMSKERVSILKGYGAEVILTPAADYMVGSNQKAEEPSPEQELI